MTDCDVVERVGALLERAVVRLRPRKSHYKRPFATTIKGAPAVALMNAVRPFLGESRRAQIERAVASWHGRRARWSRASPHCLVKGCARPGSRRGLCRRHYDRWWKARRRGVVPGFAPVDAPVRDFGPSSIAGCSENCELAWLVGLLEGEGTFTVTGVRGPMYPVVAVKMCDEDVIQRVARMFGATVYRLEPEHEAWSPVYATKIGGHRAAEWMRRLRPFMGQRRTAAIDAALGAYHPIRLTPAPATCVVAGCGRPNRGRGLCHKHYMSWSRDHKRGRPPRVRPLR